MPRNSMNEELQGEIGPITKLLHDVKAGREGAQEELFRRVYRQMKRLAAARLRGERANHTLQATALVHEAYLRLLGANSPDWRDHTHFFATAAHAMRHILVDYARRSLAQKRDGIRVDAELSRFAQAAESRAEDIIAVHDALMHLQEHSPRLCAVVEMRFYAGFTEQEIADALHVNARTVKRDWKAAQAWLHAEIKGSAK